MSVVVRRVASAITMHLGPKYKKLPLTEEAVKEKVTNFYNAFCVLKCLGAIDGTHIAIKQRTLNSKSQRIPIP